MLEGNNIAYRESDNIHIEQVKYYESNRAKNTICKGTICSGAICNGTIYNGAIYIMD